MKGLLAFLAVSALGMVCTAQTYTLSEHLRPCAADLSARLVQTTQGHGLQLRVVSRLDDAVAILAIGDRAPAPVALPGGHCSLYVTPRATIVGSTNGLGVEQFAFRIPPVLPIDILFQAVVVDVTPAGRLAASSDVVRLRGR